MKRKAASSQATSSTQETRLTTTCFYPLSNSILHDSALLRMLLQPIAGLLAESTRRQPRRLVLPASAYRPAARKARNELNTRSNSGFRICSVSARQAKQKSVCSNASTASVEATRSTHFPKDIVFQQGQLSSMMFISPLLMDKAGIFFDARTVK